MEDALQGSYVRFCGCARRTCLRREVRKMSELAASEVTKIWSRCTGATACGKVLRFKFASGKLWQHEPECAGERSPPRPTLLIPMRPDTHPQAARSSAVAPISTLLGETRTRGARGLQPLHCVEKIETLSFSLSPPDVAQRGPPAAELIVAVAASSHGTVPHCQVC